MLKLRLVREDDLCVLASIYCELYCDSVLAENWTVETAYKLMRFFYDWFPDIFVVAEDDGKAFGAIMSLVKPWHDGNCLVETEVFVDTEYQQKGIGSRLFCEHFRLAMEKYDAKMIEAHTYENEDGYPLKWYKKQGYDVLSDLFVVNGKIDDVYRYFAEKDRKEK